MFNWIVRYSLHNRLFVLAFAAMLLVYGAITAWRTLETARGSPNMPEFAAAFSCPTSAAT